MPLVPLHISRWAAGRNEWRRSRQSCDAHRPLHPFFDSPFSDTWFSCSTQQDAVGCVWTWFVDSSATSQATTQPTLPATTSLVFDANSAVSASDVSATGSDEPSGTTSTSSLYATATTTTAASDNDNQVDDGDDDDDCEDETWASIPSTISHDATITSSATFPISSAQDTLTFQIGDGLWAGHKSQTRQWADNGASTASITGPNVSVSYAAATASSTIATPSTDSTPTLMSEWPAPHYVIYADSWLGTMPDVSELGYFNRFILAFWEATAGAVDNVQAWTSWDESYRSQVVEAYHDAGIAIMVAAFGSTDLPTTSGRDAKQVAQELASFVKAYNLDGVDIDYEGGSFQPDEGPC